MDLTNWYPRGPRDKGVGGVYWAARATDKTRAHVAGKLGLYDFDCPMDQFLFGFLPTNAAEFLAAVTSAPDDSGVTRLVEAKLAAKSQKDIDDYKDKFLNLSDDWGGMWEKRY